MVVSGFRLRPQGEKLSYPVLSKVSAGRLLPSANGRDGTSREEGMPDFSCGHFVAWGKYPTQPAAAIAVEKRIVDQNVSSLKIEFENHLVKTLSAQSIPNLLLAVLLTVQKQEPPAAGASDLAAQRSIVPGSFIKMIYPGIGDLVGDNSLRIPNLIEKTTKLLEVACPQYYPHLLRKLSNLVERIHGCTPGLPRSLLL